jgi:hypothetical protein
MKGLLVIQGPTLQEGPQVFDVNPLLLRPTKVEGADGAAVFGTTVNVLAERLVNSGTSHVLNVMRLSVSDPALVAGPSLRLDVAHQW